MGKTVSKFAFGILFFFCTVDRFIFAEEQSSTAAPVPQKINLAAKDLVGNKSDGGSAADLLSRTKVFPATNPVKSGIQFMVSCTDATGTALKPEDPGYNKCLSDAQSKSNSGVQPKPSVGFKFGK